MLTPLQRIGAQALNRTKAGTFTPPLTPRQPLRPMAKRDENRRRSYDTIPVNPAFVPLPKVDVAEVEALNRVGSEDLIVPESEGENDEAEEEIEGRRRGEPGRLGLGRFLYS